jgi:hypothetical protein
MNSDVVTIKDETSTFINKIRETDAGPIDFHLLFNFFFDVSSLSFPFFTNTDVVTIKDIKLHLNKIRETNGGKIKEQVCILGETMTS